MAGEAKLCGSIHSTFEALVEGLAVRRCWGGLDQCQQQTKFSGHLISLLSILLRCNGFTGIQKAVALQKYNKEVSKEKESLKSCSGSDRQQTTEQRARSCFWCKFPFGKCFGAASASSL